jgi:uncharacterized protein (TIGR02271 family)
MDSTTFDAIQAGWGAYGRDGDKIGDVEEIGRDYILVTKGLIFTTDLYIPSSAIDKVDQDDGRVYLNVDKSEVEDRGWTEPPVAGTDDVESTGFTGTSEAGSTAYAAQDTAYGAESTDVRDTEQVRVPLHEEQLRAERVTETAGEVRVGKSVHEEQRELDVPVTRDEVQVRRVSTDRAAATDEGAFTDGDTIRVPVTAERVNVSKEPHVVEEIEISKRPVTETQRVSETVRREEVDVDESGNVLTGAGASMTGTGHDLDETSASRTRSGGADELDDELKR